MASQGDGSVQADGRVESGVLRREDSRALPAITLVGLLGTILANGAGCACGPESCPRWESPCPDYFVVHTWCKQTGRCTVDGGATFVHELWRGETLRIPIAEFADEIGAVHYLGFGYSGPGPEPYPDATEALVTLDGVLGTQPFPEDSNPYGTIFRWEPFPDDAQLLEIRFEDGGDDRPVWSNLVFFDADCKRANPPPDCNE